MLWRAGLLSIGLFFLTAAGLSVWLVWASPGTFDRLHSIAYVGLFGTVGLVMTLTAIGSSEAAVRSAFVGFLRDLFGRRNLTEVLVAAGVIALSVAVALAVHQASAPHR